MSIPAGWYPNPQDPTTQRYWSGTAWTDHVAPLETHEPTMELPSGPPLPPPGGTSGFSAPTAPIPPHSAAPAPIAPAPFFEPEPEPWYRRKWVWVAGVVVVLIGIGSVASGNDDTKDVAADTKPRPAVTTVTAPAPPRATVTVAPSDEEEPASGSQVGNEPEAAGDTFTMPDEVGKDLQAAQDDLQAITGNPLFYTGSEDATGQDRFQVWDANWKVCSQVPKAGKKLPTDYTEIKFYVVKDDESCP